MKFRRRLKYYLIGVAMGLVVVLFIFNGRGCSWLPENRVLDDIERGDILINDRVRCEIECNDISDLEIYELFSDRNGDVLFSESDQRANPKMYMIESGNEKYKIEVYIRDTTTYIDKLHLKDKELCNCGELSDSTFLVFYIPAEKVIKNLFFLEGKELKISEKAECQMGCFDLKHKDIWDFIEEPVYIRTASEPNKLPNPVHVFENVVGGLKFRMYFEDAGRKTRLVDIRTPDESCDCI